VKFIRGAFVLIICLTALNGSARSKYIPDAALRLSDFDQPPCDAIAVHNIGRMHLTISNYGVIGNPGLGLLIDPITGAPAPSWEFPPGYEMNYLYKAALWVGAVVGRDTLVSVASGLGGSEHMQEFWPLPCPDGRIKYRSSTDRCSPDFDSAVSQQDFIAIYTDTLISEDPMDYDLYSRRFHIPLKIEVTQKSYAWAYSYAEDFVIMDFEIRNLELRDLKDVYIGLYVDNDCGKTNNPYGRDDLCGYTKTLRSEYIWGFLDTLDLVWARDNDGDPTMTGDYLGYYSPTSIVATKVLRAPTEKVRFNFNWWVTHSDPEIDWGPRRINEAGVRTFFGGLGTPYGDQNKYYMMASHEFDYNQTDLYWGQPDGGWLPVPDFAKMYTYGADIRYLLSFGPFKMRAGDLLPLTVAFISGEKFHDGLGYSDLHNNALWASWIYDNPGYDSDGDGYRGKFHSYCLGQTIARIDTLISPAGDTLFDTLISCGLSDTVWYSGDGVPDLVGAYAPVVPKVRLEPMVDEYNFGRIIIRWNGLETEATPDQFSQNNDFEGYRVYISRSGQQCDYTLLASYDIENYDRYEYYSIITDLGIIEYGWRIEQPPFTLKELKAMYGDDFDPNHHYDIKTLFVYEEFFTRDTFSYYFQKHGYNNSDYCDISTIHKIFQDQPYPSSINLDTARMFYPYEVTDGGQLKYFEYEYILKDLLSSVPYYISVVAFDHGVPQKGLPSLEADPAGEDVTIMEYAQNSSETIRRKDLEVIVYPNPYKINADYRDYYEGWQEPNRPQERTRAIHFTNLPSKCTIKIYSIDGDHIQTIEHNYPDGAPGCMHDTWDLLSRNHMLISSGIYFYAVESAQSNQVGKLVIIY
jgi:hypothetical protein